MTSATAAVWDNYWQAGHQACCLNGESGEYDQTLKALWMREFGDLKNGAKLLDLGTGNGGVLRFAQHYAEHHNCFLNLVGIDAARCVALPETTQTTVDFRPFTAMESLPFEANTFDMVTGQFAVEYSDVERSLLETLRVLRPQGKGVFMIHAEEGQAVQQSRVELTEIQQLKAVGVFAAAIRALKNTDRVEKRRRLHPVLVQKAETATERLQTRLQQAAENWQSKQSADVIRNTLGLVEDTFTKRLHFPLGVLLHKVTEIENQLTYHEKRLRLSVDAAKTRQDCQNLLNQLDRAQNPTLNPVSIRDQQIAWQISFSKNDE